MQTSTRTLVGIFNDFETAQRAADRLIQSGFSRDEIEVTSARDYAGDTATGNTSLTGSRPSDTSGGGIAGFFHRLFGGDSYHDEQSRYSEAVRRGSAIVAVHTDEDREDRAADILNDFDPVDIDERSASWNDQRDEQPKQDGGREAIDRGDRTIPVVREELRVGKRPVQRGGVRVYNRVREEPVQQQVNLREEHVRVDRHPTDRPATQDDIRAHDEVIEVREMAEEPVVEKRTRVVEEVVVGKETNNRTETIRDTVRRSEVNVEKLGSKETGRGEYEDDFRRDFQSRYGSDPSARYEMYAPAYDYGYRMASDQRYRGRSWSDVESRLKADYERDNPNSTWDRVKGSVRYGWEKVTGRR